MQIVQWSHFSAVYFVSHICHIEGEVVEGCSCSKSCEFSGSICTGEVFLPVSCWKW